MAASTTISKSVAKDLLYFNAWLGNLAVATSCNHLFGHGLAMPCTGLQKCLVWFTACDALFKTHSGVWVKMAAALTRTNSDDYFK